MCFGSDLYAEVSRDLAVQPDRDGEITEALDRLGELNLPAIDVEAFGGEFTGDVGGCDGAEELAVFAGLANFVPILGPIATVLIAGITAALDSWTKVLGLSLIHI